MRRSTSSIGVGFRKRATRPTDSGVQETTFRFGRTAEGNAACEKRDECSRECSANIGETREEETQKKEERLAFESQGRTCQKTCTRLPVHYLTSRLASDVREIPF